MVDERGPARAFSRGARGDTPRKRKFGAEGAGGGALPSNKRIPGAPATGGGCSMVDERGRATDGAEGAGGGALAGN